MGCLAPLERFLSLYCLLTAALQGVIPQKIPCFLNHKRGCRKAFQGLHLCLTPSQSGLGLRRQGQVIPIQRVFNYNTEHFQGDFVLPLNNAIKHET